jgi:hypothetical protein
MCPTAFLPLTARVAAALALSGLLVTGLPARAQTAAIADPTQPAGVAAVSPGAAGSRGSRAAGGPAAPAVWPKLQSVQVGDNGSASAMIDGRIVQVGETVGPLTLVAIDAQGVLLRGARFEQRLALLPGIEKTALAEPAAQPLAAAAPLARPLRGRARATAVASITPSPAAPAALTVPSHPAGLPLKLDLQIDTPAPNESIAPAALAQAPTKEFR